MKNKLLLLLLCLAFVACNKEDEMTPDPEGLVWQTGKNEYNMEIDGVQRNFLIHVPESYTADTKVPIVFMLHGTSGDGEKFYNISKWVSKSEAENFIAIFPTGLKYDLLDGNRFTKWSSDGLEAQVVEGTEIKDDVLFIEALVSLCKSTFNINERRLYISGFSNGGGFVKSQVVTRMGHIFAAASAVGGVGTPVLLTVEGDRKIPLHNISGSLDENVLQNVGVNEELPLSAEEIENHEDLWFWLNNMCTTLSLENSYREEPNIPAYNLMIFDQAMVNQATEYQFMMVKELEHKYPNGNNNPRGLVAVDILWPWFLEHEL